jgi:tRNA-modifying protein YgfZ
MSDAAVESPRESHVAEGSPGDVGAEYGVLQGGALVVDRSSRSRWRFLGARARETIAGLVTNDVVGLEAGRGCYAAALTPKGKIVADLRIFALRDALLVDASPRAAVGWDALVRKYINPRVTPYEDSTSAIGDVGVFGPRAAEVIASVVNVTADTLNGLVDFAHADGASDGITITVARVPDAGATGFELFFPPDLRAILVARLKDGGAIVGGPLSLDVARVEAGRPEWGSDMDEGTIPQEANLDDLGAISYTKGCYTGQETVARVHFRGHVNRNLRGLRLDPNGAMPPLHAPLVDSEGKPVGDVRSAVRSPRFGPIALAMVRRELALGGAVVARWEAVDGRPAGETTATVTVLPFFAEPS